MLERVDRGWRVFGTGLSFFTFGVAGLVLGWVVLPLLKLFVADGARRERLAREALRLSFRGFIELMRGVGVLRYECRGLEALDRPGLLILANHPSLIDAVFLMAFVRNADCVVDRDLERNPFTRGAVRAARYIRNDSGAAVLGDGIASLERGSRLIIFPEGTRTPLTGEIRLVRGAANIAVRGERDITPVIIRCLPRTLAKGEKWWQVPPRRAQYTIEVRADIPVRGFIERTAGPALAARQLTAYLRDYFTEESRVRAVA